MVFAYCYLVFNLIFFHESLFNLPPSSSRIHIRAHALWIQIFCINWLRGLVAIFFYVHWQKLVNHFQCNMFQPTCADICDGLSSSYKNIVYPLWPSLSYFLNNFTFLCGSVSTSALLKLDTDGELDYFFWTYFWAVMVFILVERSRHTLRECNETWLLCQSGSVGVVLLTVTEMKTQVSDSLEHIRSWRTVRGFQIPLHECWGGTSLGMKALSSSNIVWKVGWWKSIF